MPRMQCMCVLIALKPQGFLEPCWLTGNGCPSLRVTLDLCPAPLQSCSVVGGEAVSVVNCVEEDSPRKCVVRWFWCCAVTLALFVVGFWWSVKMEWASTGWCCCRYALAPSFRSGPLSILNAHFRLQPLQWTWLNESGMLSLTLWMSFHVVYKVIYAPPPISLV